MRKHTRQELEVEDVPPHILLHRTGSSYYTVSVTIYLDAMITYVIFRWSQDLLK